MEVIEDRSTKALMLFDYGEFYNYSKQEPYFTKADECDFEKIGTVNPHTNLAWSKDTKRIRKASEATRAPRELR